MQNTTDTPHLVMVATRLHPDEFAALKRLSSRNDRPLAREIRRAVRRYLRDLDVEVTPEAEE